MRTLNTEGGESVQVKDAFEERYSSLLGDAYEEFLDISVRFLRKSLRINTLKTTVDHVKSRLAEQGWALDPVPWCPTGFFAKHEGGRRDLGNTIEHVLGYYYIQEAASMIPAEAMDLEPGLVVLDMAASPGSKSTQIAQLMEGTGVVVCNDRTGKRLAPLGLNLQRMGANNSVLVCGDGRRFKGATEFFDRVLVDAPCSGTGAIRKSLNTFAMWNPRSVTRLSRTQMGMISAGYAALKPGGILVYSTCTLEPEENEGLVSSFLEKHEDAEVLPIGLPIKKADPVMAFAGKTYDERVKDTLRIWPQTNDTEGFFVAKIRKSI